MLCPWAMFAFPDAFGSLTDLGREAQTDVFDPQRTSRPAICGGAQPLNSPKPSAALTCRRSRCNFAVLHRGALRCGAVPFEFKWNRFSKGDVSLCGRPHRPQQIVRRWLRRDNGMTRGTGPESLGCAVWAISRCRDILHSECPLQTRMVGIHFAEALAAAARSADFAVADFNGPGRQEASAPGISPSARPQQGQRRTIADQGG